MFSGDSHGVADLTLIQHVEQEVIEVIAKIYGSSTTIGRRAYVNYSSSLGEADPSNDLNIVHKG